ncbi:MAG: acetate kinase, partial [Rikenellaceae bacterium]
LVLNCGSSSIKYQVIEKSEKAQSLLAKGGVERIGLSEGILVHKPTGKDKVEIVKAIPDHTIGINMILSAIVDKEYGVIKSFDNINAVGHRVAHGGEYFTQSVIVDSDTKSKIENCFELAPLHNPANFKGILAIEALMPKVPQVAVFDTSFHQTIPAENFLYAIPYRYYTEMKIRKYGFHGTSHKFVAQKACDMLGLDINNSKLITCHIGNGASVTAVLNGKSIDTSMGFTPVDGLVMGTRCGAIDPGVLLYIADKKNMSTKEISNLINKESGMMGLSGVSSDMRDIHSAIEEGNTRTKTALKVFNNRIVHYVGAYAALMNGVDAIVFTGGIGENDEFVREGVCKQLEFLGLKFNYELNHKLRGKDMILSKEGSKLKAVIATTDEELVIATDTYNLLKK